MINVKDRLVFLQEKLTSKNYRVTPQRLLIMEIFCQHEGAHLSAEDIYRLVSQQFPDIGLATVYRTLELFAKMGIIERVHFGDGKNRYELTQHGKHAHHHLICIKCGGVAEVDEDLLEKLERAVGEEYQFDILDHQVKFYGYCQRCRKGDTHD